MHAWATIASYVVPVQYREYQNPNTIDYCTVSRQSCKNNYHTIPTLFLTYLEYIFHYHVYLIWCAGWCKVCDGPYSFLLTSKISSWIASLWLFQKKITKIYSIKQINQECSHNKSHFRVLYRIHMCSNKLIRHNYELTQFI